MNKLTISKKDLKSNLEVLRCMKDEKCKIIAVVKANGMGLDLVKYSEFLVHNDIKMLAVSEAQDAIILRKNNILEDILLLTPENNEEILKLIINNKITLTISSIEQLETITKINSDKKVTIHIKIDTGMGRYGFKYLDIYNIEKEFYYSNIVDIEGVYTHFSNSINEKDTLEQFKRFEKVKEYLIEKNYNIKMFHCCNSTAFIKYPNMHLDAVRLGSIMQGRTLIKTSGLKTIGLFKTNIKQIKIIEKGRKIGYGNTYKLKRNSKLAIIPIGHADGFERKNKRDDFRFIENIKSILIECRKLLKPESAKVIIKGKKYPIVGRIGLNYSIIDITSDNNMINLEDEVILDVKPIDINWKIIREYI